MEGGLFCGGGGVEGFGVGVGEGVSFVFVLFFCVWVLGVGFLGGGGGVGRGRGDGEMGNREVDGGEGGVWKGGMRGRWGNGSSGQSSVRPTALTMGVGALQVTGLHRGGSEYEQIYGKRWIAAAEFEYCAA